MSNSVFRLPASTTMTAEQALKTALEKDFKDVLIAGYDKEGELLVFSSRMTRAEALFLAEKTRLWTINGGL